MTCCHLPSTHITLQQELQRELPYFFGIWNGGGDTFESRYPLVKSIDRF